MVQRTSYGRRDLDGLQRLQIDIWARAFFVLWFVLVFLSLAAIFAQPARALGDAPIDEAADVVETTTTTVVDNGASGGEEDDAAPAEEVVAETLPPLVEEVAEVAEDVAPLVEEVVEVGEDVTPGVEELAEIVEGVPPVVEELIDEELLEAVDVVVDFDSPVVTDVMAVTPSQVVDVILVLPLFVPDPVESPGPIELPTDPVVSTTSNSAAVPLVSAFTKEESGQPFFTRGMVEEMAPLHPVDLTDGPTAAGSSGSPLPKRETPPLAAYVPIAGAGPVVGGAGSSSSSSSHSGSSFFGVDAFGFFAAMAALLGLCLVGWIRDRSRSGRSIFPSHGGRPG